MRFFSPRDPENRVRGEILHILGVGELRGMFFSILFGSCAKPCLTSKTTGPYNTTSYINTLIMRREHSFARQSRALCDLHAQPIARQLAEAARSSQTHRSRALGTLLHLQLCAANCLTSFWCTCIACRASCSTSARGCAPARGCACPPRRRWTRSPPHRTA